MFSRQLLSRIGPPRKMSYSLEDEEKAWVVRGGECIGGDDKRLLLCCTWEGRQEEKEGDVPKEMPEVEEEKETGVARECVSC